MGLPLLIIGSISTAEDRLAMLIPGAILFVVGAFVTIVAAVKRATTSEQDIAQQRRGSGIEILEAVLGKPVRFRINNRPSSKDAWVGIYPVDAKDIEHGDRWGWLRDKHMDNASLPGQSEGRWSIRVFSDGGYTLHDRVDFDIVSAHNPNMPETMPGQHIHDPEKAAEFARSLGLNVGGAGHPFVGNWQTKGFYAYRSGQYSGIAYFGSGGSEHERLAYPSESEKYRPWNRDDPKIPEDIRQKLIRLEDIQIKQEIQEKKEEMSEQIKEKMEQVEEKLPEEIKEIESFQEIKSTVENTVESLDEKANQAIEEVMVESTEQMEQVQEKVLLSLEDSLSKLNDTLERLDKALMTKDRENIISELSGSQMNLNLTVDRIDNTIGYGIDEALRGGKTIVGNIEGIPHSVSIKVPESMNDFTSGLEKGQTIEQKVTLSTFNSVRKMLEFVIDK
ncbi:MAG: hypothetical protein VYE59_04215 [Candidatus Thermoplasmatota archaeon]|nr:hypothetical protein [Candidatus Thermoplasmatota archaeon]